jgi:hypothetical protein
LWGGVRQLSFITLSARVYFSFAVAKRKETKEKATPSSIPPGKWGRLYAVVVWECYCALRWFYPCAGWLFGFGGYAVLWISVLLQEVVGGIKKALITGWAADGD